MTNFRRLRGALLFPLFSLMAFAQQTGPSAFSAADSSYFLQYPTLYFGTLCAGETLELPFTIQNTSKQKITVAELKTSPPFSIVTPIAPFDLNPGELAPIRVNYSPTGTGSYSSPFIIRLSGRSAGDTLTIRGDAKDNSISISASTLDYGDLPVGRSAIRTAVLRNTGGDTITIGSLSIVPGGTPFTILNPSAPLLLAPGDSVSLQVRYAPVQPVRSGANASIHIDLPCPKTKIVTLVGNGIRGELGWGASAISYPDLWCPGDRIRDSIVVTNVGTDTLSVFGASIGGADAGDFRLVSPPPLPLKLQPNQQLVFVVEFRPLGWGTRSGILMIRSADASSPVKNIPLTGRVNRAIFAASPPSVDFGDIRVGDRDTTTILVRNPNPVPARIAAVRFLPPDPALICLTPLPVMIGAGDSLRMAFSLAASSPGTFRGTVTLSFDLPCLDSLAAPITARGIQGSWILDGQPFGPAIKCTTLVSQYILHNTGTADFTIDSARIEGADGALYTIRSAPQLPDRLPPTGFAAFRISFSPVPPPNGPRKGYLLLFLHNADRDTVRYDLGGLRVSPELQGAQVDFGALDLRVTSTQNATLRNLDVYRIAKVSFLDIFPPQFQYLGGKNFPVDSLAVAVQSVRFAPDSERMFTGSLRFVYGACNDTLVVPLTGIGRRCRVDALFSLSDSTGTDTLRAAMGQTIGVPLSLAASYGPDNISFLRFTLRYDKTLLLPLRLERGGLTQGVDMQYAVTAPGVLVISIRGGGATLQPGPGILALITFACAVGEHPGGALSLTLDSLEEKCFTTIQTRGTYFSLLSPCVDRPSEILLAAGKNSISRNAPNPFNPRTTIEYYIAAEGEAELTVHTLLGEKVATLAAGHQTAGYHRAEFDAGPFPAGVYVAILRSAEGAVQRTMLSVK